MLKMAKICYNKYERDGKRTREKRTMKLADTGSEKKDRRKRTVGREEEMSDEKFSIKEYLKDFRKEIRGRFDKTDDRLDKMDNRLDKMDDRFDKTDARLNSIDNRLDKIDNRLDKMDDRFDKMDDRLDKMDDRL